MRVNQDAASSCVLAVSHRSISNLIQHLSLAIDCLVEEISLGTSANKQALCVHSSQLCWLSSQTSRGGERDSKLSAAMADGRQPRDALIVQQILDSMVGPMIHAQSHVSCNHVISEHEENKGSLPPLHPPPLPPPGRLLSVTRIHLT